MVTWVFVWVMTAYTGVTSANGYAYQLTFQTEAECQRAANNQDFRLKTRCDKTKQPLIK